MVSRPAGGGTVDRHEMVRERGHREDGRRLYALYCAGYVRNGASYVQSYQ